MRRTRSRSPTSIAARSIAKNLIIGGYWSAYWYNGNIYGAEISRGVDLFRLVPTQHLSQNEIDAAIQVRTTEFNAQNQPLIKWPATSIVAKAYLDQLGRTNAISAERAKAVRDNLAKVDELRTGKERDAAARLDALTAVAAQVEADAKTKTRPRRDAADCPGRHPEGPSLGAEIKHHTEPRKHRSTEIFWFSKKLQCSVFRDSVLLFVNRVRNS